MKRILLSRLTLRNFKGIENLELNFEGSANIYGANESGKSTVYTAFNWLLTGKDEFDRKDYEIKNTVKPQLNSQAHEVEAVLIVNGQEQKLKRVYLEDWQKPKGQSTKVFKGHYTDYYVNDVPCSATEYQVKVDAIIPGNIIKLVTNPTYFNTLNWDKQRAGLIQIAGEITDEQIFDQIASPDRDFGTLVMVLNSGKSAEEYKKELAAKKLLLKKAAVEYAPRIDEARRNMPQPSDWIAIENEIATVEAQIKQIENALEDALESQRLRDKELLKKRSQITSKQSELLQIKSDIKNNLIAKKGNGAAEILTVKAEIRTITETINRLRSEDENNERNRKVYQSRIDEKTAAVENLRAAWKEINAETFSLDESACECPTCKRPFDAEIISAKHDEMLAAFHKDQEKRKADKVERSNQIKTEISQLHKLMQEMSGTNETLIAKHNSELELLNLKLADLQKAEASKGFENIDVAVEALLRVNEGALNLGDEIASLEAEIAAANTGAGDNDPSNNKALKESMKLQVNDLRKKLATRETIELTEKRIAQLMREEAANAQEIANLENQEFDCETYTRAKMDILEQKVNGMFQYVSFRLFEKQVNGGIAETCVCEYNGVPYPTLNTAAKLLAGLDVLNTLSKFYGISAPVFCDNRESVTFIPESKSQIISLFVSPEDKKIRYESVKSRVAVLEEA